MLRTTYTKKISQKDEVVLQTNHNYFIRAAIAAVAKVCLASCIMFALTFVVSLIVLPSSTSTANAASDSAMTLTLITLIFSFALVVYIIVVAANLLSTYKKSNEIESSIFGDKIISKSSSVEYKGAQSEDDEEEF